jgi:hypothetical protein
MNGTIETPTLAAPDRMSLKMAVEGTQSGLFSFYVAFTYDKQSKAKPRIAGVDFLKMPGVGPKLHMGWLYSAPINKKGEVYLLVADVARADGDKHFGWTAIRPEGLRDFQIRGIAPVVPAQSPQPAGVPSLEKVGSDDAS